MVGIRCVTRESGLGALGTVPNRESSWILESGDLLPSRVGQWSCHRVLSATFKTSYNTVTDSCEVSYFRRTRAREVVYPRFTRVAEWSRRWEGPRSVCQQTVEIIILYYFSGMKRFRVRSSRGSRERNFWWCSRERNFPSITNKPPSTPNVSPIAYHKYPNEEDRKCFVVSGLREQGLGSSRVRR